MQDANSDTYNDGLHEISWKVRGVKDCALKTDFDSLYVFPNRLTVYSVCYTDQ